MNSKVRKIRVMHVVSKVYPYAGMERKVIQLLNNLDRNHFKPFLLSMTDIWGTPSNYLNQDVELHALHKMDGIQLRLVLKLAKILKSRKIHIIHSHNWATLFHSVIAAHIARVPVIVHGEHGRDTKELDTTLKRSLIRRLLYALVNKIVVVAKDLEDIVVHKCKVSMEKVRLIINGVDINDFQKHFDRRSIKRKFRISNNSIVIATVAKLRPVKDLPTLIKAFKFILDQFQNAQLFIIGSYGINTEPLQRELNNLIKELDLQQHVKFCGEINNIPEILSIVDVYVNSSVSEGMSNTILEAMASGIPVVATRVGGNSELVVEGKTGYLFDVQNPQDCARKVLKILNSPQLKKQMASNSRNIIQRYYPIEETFRKNQEMYKELYFKKSFILY